MAYTQTFQLAQRARGKLQREASKHDHNLRLLVGHANLLDNLMVALADAEREQEQWFNEVVRDSIAAEDGEDEDVEEDEEEESRDWPEQCYDGHGWLAADYSDSESEEDSGSEADSDEEMGDVGYMPRLTRKSSHRSLTPYFQTTVGVNEVDEYDEDFEDEDGMYTLTRTSSHGSPPQLVADLTDDEEEESTPPSPPQLSLPFTPIKGKERIVTTSFFEENPHSSHHETFLDRIHPPSSVISTF